MVPTLAEHAFESELDSYRAVSTLAVTALVLGVVSLVSFAGTEFLLTVPPVAAVVGFLALRRVRNHSDALTGRGLALLGLWLAGLAFLGASIFHTYVYATEVPEGYERISFAELQPDKSVAGQIVPPRAGELDGRKVFIKGYMLPGRQTNGIREFMLVWNSGDCCFGGAPPLTHMIVVKLKPPLEASYTSGVQRVGGTFHRVRTKALEGLGDAVYELEADYLP